MLALLAGELALAINTPIGLLKHRIEPAETQLGGNLASIG